MSGSVTRDMSKKRDRLYDCKTQESFPSLEVDPTQSTSLPFSWAVLFTVNLVSGTAVLLPRTLTGPSSFRRIHVTGFRGVKRRDGNCRVLRARLICISMASLFVDELLSGWTAWILLSPMWITILDSYFLQKKLDSTWIVECRVSQELQT